jgi:hypothetical protein
MTKNEIGRRFKVHDHVSWNSEAGRVSGRILRVHTKEIRRKGYILHASKDDPRYEIKSDKLTTSPFTRGQR